MELTEQQEQTTHYGTRIEREQKREEAMRDNKMGVYTVACPVQSD